MNIIRWGLDLLIFLSLGALNLSLGRPRMKKGFLWVTNINKDNLMHSILFKITD